MADYKPKENKSYRKEIMALNLHSASTVCPTFQSLRNSQPILARLVLHSSDPQNPNNLWYPQWHESGLYLRSNTTQHLCLKALKNWSQNYFTLEPNKNVTFCIRVVLLHFSTSFWDKIWFELLSYSVVSTSSFKL